MRVKDNTPEIMLSPSELAVVLGVSEATIRDWVNRRVFQRIDTVITSTKTYYFVSLDELVEIAKSVHRMAEMTYKYKYPAVWIKGETVLVRENLQKLLKEAGYPHNLKWGYIPAVSLLTEVVGKKLKKLSDQYAEAIEKNVSVALIEKIKLKMEETQKVFNALQYYRTSRNAPEDIPFIDTGNLLRIIKFFYPYTNDISDSTLISRIITHPHLVYFSFGEKKKRFYPVWAVMYVVKYGTDIFPLLETEEDNLQ